MGSTTSPNSSTALSNNAKLIAHETALQQCLISFQDLVIDINQLKTDSENYKTQYISLKEQCENKTCCGVKELKKVIETKDIIIQSVASILTKLNETKNLDILTEAFKILFGEAVPLTPPLDDKSPTPSKTPIKNHLLNSSIDDNIVFNEANTSATEESMCEIEGTPTGRTSPILNTKIAKISGKTSDFRDKKKCPDEWATPERKAIKLTYPSPASRAGSGKYRQTRLNLVKVTPATIVDLTACPELVNKEPVQPLIKKESIENDDTILPSPTSGPTNFTLLKSISKASPSKFKKPLSLKIKTEKSPKQENEDILIDKTKTEQDISANILDQLPKRIQDIKTESPINMEAIDDEDATNCENNSLILQLDKIEAEHIMKQNKSPLKRPLATNINIMNTPPKHKEEADSSMSILRPEPGFKQALDNVKRQIPELVQPIYKEPTVRNKAEKRALQGWSCEECKNFYGVLYKDDPVMLARKIQECSKHRGRHNPARPNTPPNFWNPRWHVPEDTEELNRMNNAT